MMSIGSRPLAGRVALVTGVSRRIGIAYTVARRLHALGATIYVTGWTAHDADQPWGTDVVDDSPFDIHQHDMADPAVPAALIDDVIARHGAIDIVAAVHARSSHYALLETTAEELDVSWAVNVRSIVLLARRFAEVHRVGRPQGRMLWFTSGQAEAPMSSEIPYGVTKGALHQMTATIANALIDHDIVANCINPGPVDTGWATPEVNEIVKRVMPQGRWGTPDDVANLVAFLVSDEGRWICGQVINSEGGFRRSG
jgi:3-oxoacyl-[acyl-carrier protein] reductase